MNILKHPTPKKSGGGINQLLSNWYLSEYFNENITTRIRGIENLILIQSLLGMFSYALIGFNFNRNLLRNYFRSHFLKKVKQLKNK